MIYRVTASFKEETASELRDELNDGSIAAQQPDGPEIVDALRRAVRNATGTIEWTECCYCDPPLAHERSTVLDRYFEKFKTEAVGKHRQFEGQPFLQYLEEVSQ